MPSWFLRISLRAAAGLGSGRLVRVVGPMTSVADDDLLEVGRLLGRGGGVLLVHGAWGENRYQALRQGAAVNQVPPHDFQRPHRHNSAAVTLSIQGKTCYSLIGGKRVDWQENAVMVTPPGDVHSHHNDGNEQMTCLIVQDGGLYYHCRTMGFEFA